MKIKAYFAHPEKLKDSQEKYQIYAELCSRQINVIDPFKEEQHILDEFGVDRYYGNECWELARRLWTNDLGAIKSCKILVAWVPTYESALGTMSEIDYAYINGSFIQVISPILHPSFAVYADQLFQTIDDFIYRREYRWKTCQIK